MTEQEFLNRLQEQCPQEFSAEELDQLRTLLPTSPALREQIVGEVRLEELLAGALGRPEITAKAVMARARNASPTTRWMARLGWMIGLCLLIGAPAVWWQQQQQMQQEKAAELPVQSRAPQVAVAEAVKAVTSPEPDQPSELPAESPAPTTVAATPVEPPVAKPDLPVEPVPTVSAVPAPPPDPLADWPELDLRQTQLKPWNSTVFDFELGTRLNQTELRRWLGAVPGHTHKFMEDRRNESQVSGFQGLVKLHAPWPQNAALRFAPFEHEQFAMHLWNGDAGVTLAYYQHDRQGWAAYRTTRVNGSPRPVTYALIATDGELNERTNYGPLDLRWQNQTLVLSRGNLRLLTVPFPDEPRDVYFDKRAWFRAFQMYLAEPLPEDGQPPEAVAAEATASVLATPPGRLEWNTELPAGTRFIQSAESVEFSADKGAPLGWAAVRLPRASLYELIFQVDQMTPGTGLYLGDETGKPVHVLAFLRDQRTRWTTLGFAKPDLNGFESSHDMLHRPVPVVQGPTWLRLVAGSGTLKCWISGDGTHWSRALEPVRGLRGAYATVGLMAFKHDQPRHIVLRELAAREFKAVTSLADVEHCAAVPEAVYLHQGPLSRWLTHVLDSQPQGVPATPWRMACAVRTLAAVPKSDLGNALLNGIAEDVLAGLFPGADTLAVLRAEADLWDTWEPAECVRLAKLFEAFGKQLIRDGNPRPWSIVGNALLTAPIWSQAKYDTMPEFLVREELVGLLYRDEWAAAEELSDRVSYYNLPSHPDVRWPDLRLGLRNLVLWVQGSNQHGGAKSAVAASGGKRRRADPKTLPTNFRHPLIVELSKEEFNTLAEMQVALSEGAFREACQIIASADPLAGGGLLPDTLDNALMVTFHQAVANAMREHAGLRAAMVKEFGGTAQLRMRQALADGNVSTVEAAAVQFFGTEPAAQCRLWLGERDLANGDFIGALTQLDLAGHSAPAEMLPVLAVRRRLAAAMLGQDLGTAPQTDVEFSGQRFSPAEFEQMVVELRQQALQSGGATLAAVAPRRLVETAPPRVKHELQAQRLPGLTDVGLNAGGFPPGQADWVAQQMACQIVGDTLYAGNRYQLNAYDLSARNIKWTHALGGEQGDAHQFHLTPVLPVVAGSRIFVRRLTKEGIDLVALDAATGQPVWRMRPPDTLISDPLPMQDQLLAFTQAGSNDGTLLVSLTALNPLTGAIDWQRPVVRLMDAWSRQTPCTAAVAGSLIVANIGGTVLCCDSTGQPQWIRRQTWLPASNEPAFWDQERIAPVVLGDRVLVMQPGVLSLECLELEGGRRLWCHPSQNIERLIGAAGGHAVLGTKRGIECLSLETGKLVWSREIPRMLHGAVLAADGTLVVAQSESFLEQKVEQPRLIWLEPATGVELGTEPLPALADKSPRLGPLLARNGELLAFVSKTDKDVTRELVSLTPGMEPLQPGREPASPVDAWVRPMLDPKISLACGVALPGWQCLGSGQDATTGLAAEVQGQKDVFVTLATYNQPAVFAREFQLPADKKSSLYGLVGQTGAEKWVLDVRVAGQTLKTLSVESADSSNGWKEFDVDLSAFAGQTVTVLLEQVHSGSPAHGLWKRLELR